jgi:hypothetical protein
MPTELVFLNIDKRESLVYHTFDILLLVHISLTYIMGMWKTGVWIKIDSKKQREGIYTYLS